RCKGTHGHANQQCNSSHFRSSSKECGYRGWCTFINVRCPHMERNSGDFECQTGHDEDQTEDQTQLTLSAGNGSSNISKVDCACVTIDQRNTVEQHARRQSAE